MGNIKLISSPLLVDMFTLVKLNGKKPMLFYTYLHYILPVFILQIYTPGYFIVINFYNFQGFMQDQIIASHTCFGGHVDINC